MTVEDKLDALHEELRGLRELVELRLVNPAAPERTSALVGAQEAAQLLGVSVRSIREGKAGTSAIPRQQSRPIRFLRTDIHKFIRERAEKKKTAKERALRLLDRTKPRKRRVA